MEYYERHMLAYLSATPKERKESKEHWIKCHKQNIASGRNDLIIFSAKMLGSICIADDIINKGTLTSI